MADPDRDPRARCAPTPGGGGPLRHRRDAGADRRRPRGGRGPARGAGRARRPRRAATGSSPASADGGRAPRAGSSGVDELTYAGNHGLELLEPGRGRAAPRSRARPSRERPRPASRRGSTGGGWARRLGLRLEDKGPIQAIHWRGAADARAAAERGRARSPTLADRAGPHAALRPQGARAAAGRRRRTRGSRSRRLIERGGVDARRCSAATTRPTSMRSPALRELAGSRCARAAVCVGGRVAGGAGRASSPPATWWSTGRRGSLRLCGACV